MRMTISCRYCIAIRGDDFVLFYYYYIRYCIDASLRLFEMLDAQNYLSPQFELVWVNFKATRYLPKFWHFGFSINANI